MKIFYLGDDSPFSTSAHRAEALRRLGHEVTHVNARGAFPSGRIAGGIAVRFGFGVFAPLVAHYIRKCYETKQFDLVWVNGGAEIGPAVYRFFQSKGVKIVNYQNDDPFGKRDGKKWNLYLASLPLQDLTVVVRESNVAEARREGARRVLRVFMSYDPVAHAPVEMSPSEVEEWKTEVSFVGAWMPERGPFLKRLIELGVPLSIRGDWWHKAPEWGFLKPHWIGPAVGGSDYVRMIQAAKVSLGLLSKGNRDFHTQRSFEVPFIGGSVFCAERTEEHREIYKEGVEAEFWVSPEECAAKCLELLGDEPRRLRMAAAAKAKVESLRLSNDAIVEDILNEIKKGV